MPEKQKKVYLKDIAERLGVSTALVSYVLNNKNGNRIGKEIAAKIRLTAAELNYRPNLIAKSLRTKKSFTLGVIAADISNPFYAEIAASIEVESSKNSYTVFFASSNENKKRLGELIDNFISKQVDGIIVAPADHSEEEIDVLIEHKIPLVLIDRTLPNRDINYVITNNFEASYNAVNHLLENKFKSIGIISYNIGISNLKARKRGYIQAIEDAKLEVHPSHIHEVNEQFIYEEVRNSIDLMLKKPKIDAIFFTTNKLAIAGLRYLKELDIKVPQEIGIVAFDECDAYHLFPTSITHVSQPLKQIAEQAVKLLISNIQEESGNQAVGIVLKSSLIVQDSSKK